MAAPQMEEEWVSVDDIVDETLPPPTPSNTPFSTMPEEEINIPSVEVILRNVEPNEGNDTTNTSEEPKQQVQLSLRGPPEEPEKAKESEKSDRVTIRLYQLFRFAKCLDLLLIGVGIVGATVNGLLQPTLTVVLGETLDAYNDPENFQDAVTDKVLLMILLGAGAALAAFCQVYFLTTAARRQCYRISEKFSQSLLSQEMEWFDMQNPRNLTTVLGDQILAIEEAIGRKLGSGVQYTMMFVAGYAVGFYKGWKLTLILLTALPPLAVTGWFMMKTLANLSMINTQAYERAAGIVSEILEAIRTVTAFGRQDKECHRYSNALASAEATGIQKALRVGIATGLVFLFVFSAYGAGLWYGGVLVAEDVEQGCHTEGTTSICLTGGDIITIFFCVIAASTAIGQAIPSFTAIAAAKATATRIFMVIDRPSLINPLSLTGDTPHSLHGDIEFRGVTFSYARAPERKVLNELSFKIPRGKTVAFVGHSGSGKSTIVSLLLRLYEPSQGTIMLNDVELSRINTKWLRDHIGVVQQEPVLFSGTIAENIRGGLNDIPQQDIENAAISANAHEFISRLPHGYDTEVGERGIYLSGGQKQRIAIARALSKNPSLLLLDEATSALDNNSEALVQKALDELLQNGKRTTIVIAHRLSTIRSAHKIMVVADGRIVEQGTHEDLLLRDDGHYLKLVNAQLYSTVGSPTNWGTVSSEVSDGPVPETPLTYLDHNEDHHQSKHSASMEASLQKDSTQSSPDKEKPPSIPRARIWKLNYPELYYIGLGASGAVILGAVFPCWGLLLAKMISIFYQTDPGAIEAEAREIGIYFITMAIVSGLGNVAQFYGFGVAGERLVRRLRERAFRSILRQDMAWFDLSENSTAALSERLSSDCSMIQSRTGEAVGRTVTNIVTLIVALAVAFIYSWELTLIMGSVLPLLILAGRIQMTAFNGQLGASVADEQGASCLSEALINIRTVIALNLQESILLKLKKAAVPKTRNSRRQSLVAAGGFGASQFMIFGSQGMVFWYASQLLALPDSNPRQIDFEAMIIVIMTIIMAAYGFGNAAQGATEKERARLAISRTFELIDRQPAIDSSSRDGDWIKCPRGTLTFKNVQFSYPARNDIKVCKGLDFNVRGGQRVALVGPSGSGKSTLFTLLERFYDPSEGEILFDKKALTELNPQWLRSQIGWVQQEPVMFTGTVAENIAYGKEGASLEEIDRVSKLANAHCFIKHLPQRYNTIIGPGGQSLSGGQKQRLAIARAMLRNPCVLLLDEATSALDSESERTIQQSLNLLLGEHKMTTIIIAHRLSTIRDVDRIFFVDKGRIIAEGKHEILVRDCPAYTEMVAQMEDRSSKPQSGPELVR